MEKSEDGEHRAWWAHREATQTMFISLAGQVEMLTALLQAGVLPASTVLPMLARIRSVANSWTPSFSDGADMLLVPLDEAERLLARLLKDERTR